MISTSEAAEALFPAFQSDRGRLLHRRKSCSAFPSANAMTCRSIIPMCGSGRSVREGQVIGLFYGDYFARAGKQGGAWMSSFRDQHRLDGRRSCRSSSTIAISTKAEPCLLSFDDARDPVPRNRPCPARPAQPGALSAPVRHQCGARFRRIAVAALRALAGRTGGAGTLRPPLPDRRAHPARRCCDKLLAARNYNQGFATVEFLASAIDRHGFPHTCDPAADPAAGPSRKPWPASACRTKSARAMPRRISPMSSAATAIPPAITPISGRRCWMPTASRPSRRRTIPSIPPPPTGFTSSSIPPAARRDFATAYRAFRGRDPKIEALLEGRGLLRRPA